MPLSTLLLLQFVSCLFRSFCGNKNCSKYWWNAGFSAFCWRLLKESDLILFFKKAPDLGRSRGGSEKGRAWREEEKSENGGRVLKVQSMDKELFLRTENILLLKQFFFILLLLLIYLFF